MNKKQRAERKKKAAAKRTVQLTVRSVPAHVKKSLASRAEAEGKSLNTILVEVLSLSAGESADARYRDLAKLSGLWKEDPEFDRAVLEQDQIDLKAWQ